jgi:hypothetical protein
MRGDSYRDEAQNVWETVVDPDLMLPEQFFESYGAVSPAAAEERLMLAVLENAVGTYQKYAFARDRHGRGLFAEASRWIEANDGTWPCSFVNICHALGLEPAHLRSGLDRWRARLEPRAGTAATVMRFPFRRATGSRHAITGGAPRIRRSA